MNQAQQVKGMRIRDIPVRAHVEQRGDEVQRAQQRADAENCDADNPEIHAGALARAGNLSRAH
mgnify:CR=1 FL=1